MAEEDALPTEIASLKQEVAKLEARVKHLEWRADHNLRDPVSNEWEAIKYNLEKSWPLILIFMVIMATVFFATA